jgi:hypothetical protein
VLNRVRSSRRAAPEAVTFVRVQRFRARSRCRRLAVRGAFSATGRGDGVAFNVYINEEGTEGERPAEKNVLGEMR